MYAVLQCKPKCRNFCKETVSFIMCTLQKKRIFTSLHKILFEEWRSRRDRHIMNQFLLAISLCCIQFHGSGSIPVPQQIPLCQPTGMSWRRIMLSRSLYFWCQTGVGFGGWLENRHRSQGAQELLLHTHFPRSAM